MTNRDLNPNPNPNPTDPPQTVWFRASWMMLLGLGLTVLMADPLVDVMDGLGDR